MESINVRLKDMRYPYGQDKIQQQELAKILNIPVSTLNEYEQEGNYVPSDVIIKYCKYFHVSADYLLGLTDIRNKPNADIHELHLSDIAIEKLKNQQIDPWLLTDIIEHEQFDCLMLDASIYVDGYLDEGIHRLNSSLDFHRKKLSSVLSGNDLESRKLDETLTRLHINQDIYFAQQMQERFKVILQDIKKKHQNDASTSDYNPENSSDFTMKSIMQ